MKNIRHTADKLLPAIAYGDAAGLPVETWEAKKIADTYGHIEELISPALNPFYEGASIGSWSDDTQLSLALTRALIKNRTFDISHTAQEHIEELQKTPKVQVGKGDPVPRGWGHSTAESIQKLVAGVSPDESGKEGGAGNGIVMKMSPLVLWHIGQNTPEQKRWNDYDSLTTMTHDSDTARVCTRVHGDVLQYLFVYGNTDLGQFAYARAKVHEQLLATTTETSDSLRFLTELKNFDQATILDNTDGKGFWVPQTLAMAYASYIQHAPEVSTAIFAAVNLGGDTDSNASIVAAMLNFSEHGIDLPEDAGKLNALSHLQAVSTRLGQTVLGL